MAPNTASSTAVKASTEAEAQKSVVVTYDGEKYDITKLLDNHPGGRQVLEDKDGEDITDDFDEVNHSKRAKLWMRKYKLGPDGKLLAYKHKRESTYENDPDYDESLGKVLSKKLFTKEDQMFVHKTLGLLSLFSFIYRYWYMMPTTGTLGFERQGWLECATLVLHMLLSASSLIFHVLEKRIAKNPLVIYEEYRLHAIAFTARALGVTALGWGLRAYGGEGGVLSAGAQKWLLGLFMVAIHQVVDLITRRYGTPGTTAVRNRDDGQFKQLKLFFSFYQFCAIGSHVVLHDRLEDLGWNAVGAIQSSAFLMTLKRKGMIRWKTYAYVYGFALVLSLVYMWMAIGTFFFLAVAVVFYGRTQLRGDKYVLWFLFSLAWYGSEAYLGEGGVVGAVVGAATSAVGGGGEL